VLIADINRTGPVQTVVRSARRRRICLLALEELGLGLGIVLAGVIVMLVLGTQILRWYWLPGLGIAGMAIAAYKVRARSLSPYRVAQLLDARLGLSDSLSTAWFLLTEHPASRDAAARFQIARAERTALTVKLAGVFRFRGQRAWAVAAALAAVAFGLFAVRYLVTRNLNFEQSMIRLPLGEVLERIESVVVPQRWQQEADLQPARRQGAPPANAAQPNEKRGELLPQQDPSASQTAGPSGPSSNKLSQSRDADQHDRFQAGQGHAQSNNSSGAQTRPGGEQQQAPGSATVQPPHQSLDRENEAASNSQSSSGLMDRMKNALSSLMTKLRPNTRSQNPNGSDQTPGDKKSGDQTADARDRNGNMQQDGRNRQAGDEQNTQGAAQGQTTEKTQASQSQTSNESAERKSAGAHSGIGHTNGDKDIRDARQLRAMGKLAEIIGKRSASLTGDMTVETSSSNQRLKTEYSGRTGHHADLGGEINHDEIPVMYRDYIREYMQLVHQQAEKEQ